MIIIGNYYSVNLSLFTFYPKASSSRSHIYRAVPGPGFSTGWCRLLFFILAFVTKCFLVTFWLQFVVTVSLLHPLMPVSASSS